jgi:hypothetical protein
MRLSGKTIAAALIRLDAGEWLRRMTEAWARQLEGVGHS